MITYDTIKNYSDTFNNKTQHPLISMVDLNQSKPLKREKFTLSFYAVILKETLCGDLRYGNQYYDYAEGTLVFSGLDKSLEMNQRTRYISPMERLSSFILT